MESYNCLNIKVDKFLWLFENKALEITKEAIEEIENGFIIRTYQDTNAIQKQLEAYSKELENLMQEKIHLEFESNILNNEDWIAKYRDSIQPIECGKYYIYPPWFSPKTDKINLIIEPALAFGSGHHGSTFGCLEALNNLSLANKTLLDVGCGSGILSIAAKKSGAEVWCCDTDEIAVNATKENAQKNNLNLDKVFLGSIDKITDKKDYFDVVIANILADIIVALPLDSYVKKGGILILSGILEKYTKKVLDKFKNLELLTQNNHQEWVTLTFKKI
ncbi:50S ribosomal protein L11 methyltransferase [Helicobacter canadensis]|uniref:Ribosomal protein L11 methyltransferase n=1 Tax=Helicobacter canadensis MIT 98-5491 TaxID=537970 RepID=C5ZV02_9HELI|nr:50S ribosomal protein L11 methyltransferase [Helicobacter canadensis]EES88816.1 ribosomal protein L11 methyltransferase [Helicobacter canadensis MIT 98-5491]EFR48886.1 ribosomal protein L11 methyltransferase [Helicobacter canadensis MIT 98-5491]STP00082.1 ribosomal protein methyltransferase [Helicobacter canadensis]